MNWLIGLRDWVDARLPIVRAWDTHMGKYYAPKNFNFWYFFGVLSLLVLVNQLLTGIWLTMSYRAPPPRRIRLGRVHHARCGLRLVDPLYALHWCVGLLCRGLSAHVPWSDVRFLQKAARAGLDFRHADLLALMAEGIPRLCLPWGQMSYWGAQVIISLFGAIPVVR
jgi:ubiquinol-cytochrome c reductase cytochrome b subunit